MNVDQTPDPWTGHRPSTEVAECARAVEDAIRRLARLTVDRPSTTPTDIDVVLASLASGVAAIPQAAAQLRESLDQARNDYLLSMDDMTESTDPDIAVDTARLHLDAVRQPAVEIYRHLHAARSQTRTSARPTASSSTTRATTPGPSCATAPRTASHPASATRATGEVLPAHQRPDDQT